MHFIDFTSYLNWHLFIILCTYILPAAARVVSFRRITYAHTHHRPCNPFSFTLAFVLTNIDTFLYILDCFYLRHFFFSPVERVRGYMSVWLWFLCCLSWKCPIWNTVFLGRNENLLCHMHAYIKHSVLFFLHRFNLSSRRFYSIVPLFYSFSPVLCFGFQFCS